MARWWVGAAILLGLLPAVPAMAQEADDSGQVGLSALFMASDGSNPGGPGSAIGGAGSFDLQLGWSFFVGLGPQLSVKPATSSPDSRKAVHLDFLLRLGWISPVQERFRLYFYVAPGYSSHFVGDETFGVLSMGGHLGGAFELWRNLFATLQVGQRYGIWSGRGDSPSQTEHFELAVGLLMQL